MTQPPHSELQQVIPGGGEMGGRIRSYNWAGTPLGPPQRWPQSLKTAVRIMLTSRFAMWMAWGPELTFLCNDAYLPTLGVKRDWALGSRSDRVWAEIWPDIGPRIQRVLKSGVATWDEGLRLLLERSGYAEETYHTFSYSPLANDAGDTSGMLCVVTEESDRLIGERRLRALRDLATRTSSARTEADVIAAVQDVARAEPLDLPFAFTYLLDDAGQTLHRPASAGTEPRPGLPERLNLNDPAWPLRAVVTDRTPALLEALPTQTAPDGERAPDRALALPIAQQGQARAAGALVVGLNPYRPLDDRYRSFLDLFASQVAAGLASVRAFEEERRRAQALAEIDRAKTAFFSNVSHEFRTPITLMLGPLEDVLGGPDALTGAQRGQLDLAYRNAQRLLKLVNTMLDFTRIEAGRADAAYQPTDLAAFTADLASAFRSLVEGAGLRFTVDCPPLSEAVFVDRDMWEKVVLNLLSNAFKFTFEGEIELHLREVDGQAQLTVRDSGTGIAQDQLPRVFERFHRVEGARGRTFEGTGIGLALVRELVGLHGGDIRVASALGEGTTFTVTVPLGRAHLPADRLRGARPAEPTTARSAFVREAAQWLDTTEAPAENTVDAPPGARPRVLLADDNADLRAYVQRLLHDEYDLVVTRDGEQALEAARAQRPDLVLSDVMMPHLDGFGLLRALRADPATRQLPVILLSARAGEEARLDGLEAGADDYLAKPFSARELRSRIRTQLELQRLRLEAAQQEQRRGAELERRVAERTHELEEQTAALDAFVRFTESVGTTSDPTVLAREAVAVLGSRFRQASLAYYVPAGNVWRADVLSDDVNPALSTLVREGLPVSLPSITEVLRTRQPVFLNTGDAAFGHVAHADEYGASSMYPIITAGEVTGMLSVALKHHGGWLERDRAVIRAVARSLNLALDRAVIAARLEAQNVELEARTAALEGFAELTRDLRLQSDPVALIRRAQEVVLSLLPDGYAAYYAPAGDRWRLLSQVGDRRDPAFQALVEDGLPFETTQSLHGPWTTGQAHHADVYDQQLDHLEGYHERRGALAALPVLVNGAPHGVFGVALHDQQGWRAGERAMLDTVGRSLSLALERAQGLSELAQRTQELERSNAELQQFAFVASHDLQEPLRSVTSFSELLAQHCAPGGDDTAEQYVRFIREGTSRMGQLIQDLLSFSRVATQDAPLEVVDTRLILAQVRQDLRAQIEATGTTLHLGPLPPVLGNVSQLRQLFQNLVANAIKFRAEGRPPVVQVEGVTDGDVVRFRVQDNGIGIRPEYFERIFVIFQRLHTRDRYEGSGIGLSIAKKIVERHGGQLTLSSTVGEGTRFAFTLPAAPVRA